jgi:hypothetical protein
LAAAVSKAPQAFFSQEISLDDFGLEADMLLNVKSAHGVLQVGQDFGLRR